MTSSDEGASSRPADAVMVISAWDEGRGAGTLFRVTSSTPEGATRERVLTGRADLVSLVQEWSTDWDA